MKYTKQQLKKMAKIVLKERENSNRKIEFTMLMMMRTGMSIQKITAEIEGLSKVK